MRALGWLTLLAGCAGAPDDDDVQGVIESDPVTLAFVVPDLLASFTVAEGPTTSATVPLSFVSVPEHVELAAVTLDLEATVAAATVAPTGTPDEGGVLSGTVYVADADATDACAEGDAQPPGAITLGASGAVTDVSPAEVALDDDAVATLNTGGASLCAEVESPMGLQVTLPQLFVALTVGVDCDAPAPEDLAGTWSGTYRCDNTCGGVEEDDVSLTVTQDGDRATYVDGDASYVGVVCGGAFRFLGGGGAPLGSTYREGGVLTIAEDGETATKRSTWSNGLCGGVCTDTLTRE